MPFAIGAPSEGNFNFSIKDEAVEGEPVVLQHEEVQDKTHMQNK